jgi:hypothetical protein
MASTYSTNLRLELIVTGEQQGIWGSTTNNNLGTLLEQAITGYASVAVTDGADTTLTTANGSSDQARNMILNLTGALTASRNVICPGTPKVYIVKNSTSGGFAVTFKVAGAGVSIANGGTAIIYVNGTDATVAIQTPVPVTQGGTGATTAPNALTNLGVYQIPAGTRMLFQQTAAPTGFTKDVTQNDKALRVVSGTVGSGGTTAFSSVFASRTPAGTVNSTTDTGTVGSTTDTGSTSSATSTGTVGSTVLDITQIPAHDHNYSNKTANTNSNYNVATGSGTAVISLTGTNTATSSTGGGLGHTHSLTMNAHSHTLTMNSHTHSLTMNAHNHTFSGTAMDFSVQYVDLIIATKD